jgi:hypothetical protein
VVLTGATHDRLVTSGQDTTSDEDAAAAAPCTGAAQLIAGARESARRAAGDAGTSVVIGAPDLSVR